MASKISLRKNYLKIRKKKYFEIKQSFFYPLLKLIKTRYNKKFVNLSSYYPSYFEVNTLKLFETKLSKKIKTLLPVIESNNKMNFYKWTLGDVLNINKFGMLEPIASSNQLSPDIMLVPLLAYDDKKNRLGYGGGYYDRYLNEFLNRNDNIITIGIAFSFQKYHKIPISNNDVKLNYILTEKGIIK